jgi:RimJ/RimL family protein N-acetyltransferase
MLHACHQWAAAHSLKRVTAEVYVGNQAACTLYEKNGYKLVATHENVEDDEMPFHVYVKE